MAILAAGTWNLTLVDPITFETIEDYYLKPVLDLKVDNAAGKLIFVHKGIHPPVDPPFNGDTVASTTITLAAPAWHATVTPLLISSTDPRGPFPEIGLDWIYGEPSVSFNIPLNDHLRYWANNPASQAGDEWEFSAPALKISSGKMMVVLDEFGNIVDMVEAPIDFEQATRVSPTGMGTFTVPAGVSTIFVTAIGGGGGGGGGGTSPNVQGRAAGGGGGGRGQYRSRIALPVEPGLAIPYSVGTGGTGGLPNEVTSQNGNNGTVTTFGSLFAQGGIGGTRGGNSDEGEPVGGIIGTGGSFGGGNGGTAFPITQPLAGRNYGQQIGGAVGRQEGWQSGMGGGGAASPYGSGGNGGLGGDRFADPIQPPGNGESPAANAYGAGGGGGAGALDYNGMTNATGGGNGAPGYLLIEY